MKMVELKLHHTLASQAMFQLDTEEILDLGLSVHGFIPSTLLV